MLRVALDSSRRGECFALELRDPVGSRVSGGFDPGFPFVCPEEIGSPQIYTLELAVADAAAGTWELRALGAEVTDWAYRLRAVLDRPVRRQHGLLRPNLVPWLPSEFGFVAPASANPGTAIDRLNPPGAPGTSCHAEEAPDTPEEPAADETPVEHEVMAPAESAAETEASEEKPTDG